MRDAQCASYDQPVYDLLNRKKEEKLWSHLFSQAETVRLAGHHHESISFIFNLAFFDLYYKCQR